MLLEYNVMEMEFEYDV